jgi:two-component system sensor histidine kinase BaeS
LALIGVELSMQPRTADRLAFATLFGAAALAAVILGRTLPSLIGRFRSVRSTLVAPSVAAIGLTTALVAVAAGLMFLSPHDLRVALAAIAFGAGLGVALAFALSSRLSRDLEAVGETARLVSAGDRSVRTGVDRPDEVGDVAHALDDMIQRLAVAEKARADSDEARTRLFASLSHDLRTPLTALGVAVEALEDGIAQDPDRYFRSARSNVQALGRLVDDLFWLAKMEAGAWEQDRLPVDLAELADEAVETITPLAVGRGIRVTVEASGNTKVVGGAEELGRAIRNLLDNALRHAPDRSRVRVVLSNGGSAATLRVVDEGPGFSDELQVHAFEDFITGDTSRTGTGAGLGLAIVRSVVEAHGGITWIEPGPGGRVGMRLPIRAL